MSQRTIDRIAGFLFSIADDSVSSSYCDNVAFNLHVILSNNCSRLSLEDVLMQYGFSPSYNTADRLLLMYQHINAEYVFAPYDVLQLSTNDRKTWNDYTTLRDGSEGRYAIDMVIRCRENTHKYRIVRAGKVVFE